MTRHHRHEEEHQSSQSQRLFPKDNYARQTQRNHPIDPQIPSPSPVRSDDGRRGCGGAASDVQRSRGSPAGTGRSRLGMGQSRRKHHRRVRRTEGHGKGRCERRVEDRPFGSNSQCDGPEHDGDGRRKRHRGGEGSAGGRSLDGLRPVEHATPSRRLRTWQGRHGRGGFPRHPDVSRPWETSRRAAAQGGRFVGCRLSLDGRGVLGRGLLFRPPPASGTGRSGGNHPPGVSRQTPGSFREP